MVKNSLLAWYLELVGIGKLRGSLSMKLKMKEVFDVGILKF